MNDLRPYRVDLLAIRGDRMRFSIVEIQTPESLHVPSERLSYESFRAKYGQELKEGCKLRITGTFVAEGSQMEATEEELEEPGVIQTKRQSYLHSPQTPVLGLKFGAKGFKFGIRGKRRVYRKSLGIEERIKELAATDTAQVIADKIGITRGGIMFHLHQMGIKAVSGKRGRPFKLPYRPIRRTAT